MGKSGFSKRKNFSKIIHNSGTRLQKIASHVLGRESSKNIGLKRRQITGLPGARTSLGPALSIAFLKSMFRRYEGAARCPMTP